MAFHNLRSYVNALETAGQLKRISVSVSAHLEAAEIHRRTVAAAGPTLLFENIKNSPYQLVTNLFGTKERIAFAFGQEPEAAIQELCKLVERTPSLQSFWKAKKSLLRLGALGNKFRATNQIEEPPQLSKLPLLTCWPEDGGAFVTLPVVYTESIVTGTPNVGMYRIQRYSDDETGFHCQIGKGAGFHLYEAEQRDKPLPASILLGVSPALIIAAIAPLPENVPELLFASFLEKRKIILQNKNGVKVFNDAELQICGEVLPHVRRLEGPFGDHYGYYSLSHDFPVFKAHKIYRKSNPLIPATVVGIPPQEDFYIGDYLQELFAPLLKITMPQVKELWTYGAAGFHAVAAARVQERYKREALNAAFRILGEGQLSLTKSLFITNHDCNLKSFRNTLETVLAHTDPSKDILIFGNSSLDTLDYTGEKLNEGSKLVIFGIEDTPIAHPASITGELPFKAAVFCRGCLIVKAPRYSENKLAAQELSTLPAFRDWPLVILTDEDPQSLCDSETDLLWRVFLRFEPARDLIAGESSIRRNQVSLGYPLVIDARMKPWYPKPVECDPGTKKLVDDRWGEY